jgi:NAD/FAD-utilizing enzyme apparently involved in cell division
LNLKSSQPIKSLLKISTIEYQDLYNLKKFKVAHYPKVKKLIAIRERYASYLKRQDIEIENLHKSMRLSIPRDIDYMLINRLSNEAKEKLLQIRPTSLEQKSRIPGMTSSMITILKIYLKSITQ